MNNPFINEQQCDEIFAQTLKILSEIGCKVEHPQARELFNKAGCEVEDQIVKIPADLVMKSIASAPSSFTVYRRTGEPAVVLDADHGESYFSPGVCAVYRTDRKTGERRLSTTADAYDSGLVCEALNNFAFASGLCYASDVRPELATAYEVRNLLETTTKPFTPSSVCLTECKAIIDLAAAAVGGMEALQEKPILIFTASSTSPLTHTLDNLEAAMYAFERKIPVIYLAAPLMCASAPATLAGTVAQGIADNMVGLVLSQLCREGTPYLACCFIDMMDMTSMAFTHTAPEISKGAMMATAVFHKLGLPCISHMGCTDAVQLDAQAAMDLTAQLMGSMMTGCNVSMFSGFLETAMRGSLSTLVFADEAVSYLKAMLSPVIVDEDQLAYEDIEEVGPGGDFISTDNVVENYHDLWRPTISQRVSFAKWQSSGMPTYNSIATKRVEEIIAAGVQSPLPSETLAKLDAIIAAAEKEFA